MMSQTGRIPMRRGNENGFALVSVVLLMGLLMVLLMSYYAVTHIELSTTKATMDSFRGLYAAEAGLNARAELVRVEFQGYAQPTGAPPNDDSSHCDGSNQGSGDFACNFYTILDRDVTTFVEEKADSPGPMVIPRGEAYQNLNGTEHQYVVHAMAKSPLGFPEAMLEMHFKSRLVPLFQFAAFYDKDLEIAAGSNWLLSGPVHSNGDIYLGSNSNLRISGQLTTAGTLYRGPKFEDDCPNGNVEVLDPEVHSDLPDCSSERLAYDGTEFSDWGWHGAGWPRSLDRPRGGHAPTGRRQALLGSCGHEDPARLDRHSGDPDLRPGWIGQHDGDRAAYRLRGHVALYVVLQHP